MKKVVILLLLCIPLIFMFTVFSAGTVAGLIVDIPVSSITISNKPGGGALYVDLASEAFDYVFEVAVAPLNARDRSYSFVFEDEEGAPRAGLEVDADGRLTALSVGKTRVRVVSNDGGFSDAVSVIVVSSKPIDFDISLQTLQDGESRPVALESGEEYGCDYTAKVDTGALYYNFAVSPADVAASLDVSVIQGGPTAVDEGERRIDLWFGGVVKLKFTLDDCVGGPKSVTMALDVRRTSGDAGITVNGQPNAALLCERDAASLRAYVECDTEPSLGGEDAGCVISHSFENIGGSRYVLDMSFAEDKPDVLSLSINAGGKSAPFDVSFAAFAFSLSSDAPVQPDSTAYQRSGASSVYYCVSRLSAADVEYVWSCDNGDVTLTPTAGGRKCAVSSPKKGVFKLYVSARRGGVELDEKTLEIICVESVSAYRFEGDVKLGIAQSLTVGKYTLRGGEESVTQFRLPVSAYGVGGAIAFDSQAASVTSSAPDVAEASLGVDGLSLNIKTTGRVTFTLEWRYARYFNASPTAEVTLRVVADGYETATSDDVFAAVAAGRKVVLVADVMLGTTSDSSYAAPKAYPLETLRQMLGSCRTTYNDQYLRNVGGARDINYILDIKNDVYGNGHVINAHVFTTAVDATGLPLLFKGPLSFASISASRVTGQDNVAFLMRTDGVTLDNVSLKGCLDAYLEGEEGYDLTRLNNVGTVVDVNADVGLFNCRISNGRTTLRVYGGNGAGDAYFCADAPQKLAENEKIEVSVQSCIISNAREFLLKVNANRALRKTNVPSPQLSDADGNALIVQSNDYADDDYFVERYVMTDVTLKDCVLSTAGIFCIGMETNFAGPLLQGHGGGFDLPSWADVAATSFASRLTLSGSTRLLDWKNVESIDCSTLIENTSSAQEFLKLDLGAMLEKVYSTSSAFGEMLETDGQERYVHGGIAFYGGGKNYSQLRLEDGCCGELLEFKINIACLADGLEDENDPLYMQGTMLPLAAGYEDFRFYLFGKSGSQNRAAQAAAIASGEAYTVPPAIFPV